MIVKPFEISQGKLLNLLYKSNKANICRFLPFRYRFVLIINKKGRQKRLCRPLL